MLDCSASASYFSSAGSGQFSEFWLISGDDSRSFFSIGAMLKAVDEVVDQVSRSVSKTGEGQKIR